MAALVAIPMAADATEDPGIRDDSLAARAADSNGHGLGDVVILAEEGLLLGIDSRVSGGSVVVRSAAQRSGPAGAGVGLVVEEGVVVDGTDASVLADEVFVERGAVLPNLRYNKGVVEGTVLGEEATDLRLPVGVRMPPVGDWQGGSRAVLVGAGTTEQLFEGTYGRVTVGEGATVNLTGGTYVFSSLAVADEGSLRWEAPARIVVTGDVELGEKTLLIPAPGRDGDRQHPAAVTVLGGNAEREEAVSTPVFSLGSRGVLRAAVYVPRGSLTIGEGSAVRGSLTARWIEVDERAHVSFESAPVASRGSAPGLSLTEPASGEVVTGIVEMTAVGDAGTSLERVDFYVDDQLVGSVGAEPFTLVWDTGTSAAGEHRVRAVGTSSSGLATTSGDAVVTVQTLSTEPIDPGLVDLVKDREAGKINAEEYALYGVYRWLEPDRVPQRYRAPEDVDAEDLAIPLTAALHDLESLDPDVQRELHGLLTPGGIWREEPGPLTADQIDAGLIHWQVASGGEGEESATVSQRAAVARATTAAELAAVPAAVADAGTGISRGPVSCGEAGDTLLVVATGTALPCRYSTVLADFHFVPMSENQTHGVDTDLDTWDMRLSSTLGGPNGVPDEVDVIAESFYHALAAYQDLGYPAIPHQSVGIAAVPAGVAIPAISVTYLPNRGPSTNFGPPTYLMRHELFHQVQYAYAYDWDWARIVLEYAGVIPATTTGWWMEATAEWGAHKAQNVAHGLTAQSVPFQDAAQQNYYAALLPHFFGEPESALTRFLAPGTNPPVQPQYGAFIFAEYLEEQLGQAVIRQIWETVTSETVPIDAIAHVVGQHGATLADLVTGFHRANLTVADSYTDPNRIGWLGYLPDAPRPASTTRTVGLNGEVTGSVTVEAGGVLYLDVNLAGTVEQDAVAGVRLVASGGGRAHLRAKVVRFTAHPHACDSWLADGVPMARDEGRAWATVPLSPSCSTATLVISHDHAQAYRIGEDEAASFQVSYEVSVREASDGPVDVGLVVDLSPSPEDEAAMLARQRAAAHAVVDALRPGDRAALITYDISGYVRVPLTEDTAAVHAAIDEAYDDASGWSYPNMSEGVSRAISELTSADQLDPRRGRAIVAFGDGGGWTTPSPFYLSRAASLGLPVHTVAWEPMYQGWQVEYISEATGGVFAVVDHEESPDAVLAQLLTWQRWYAAP